MELFRVVEFLIETAHILFEFRVMEFLVKTAFVFRVSSYGIFG